MCQRLTRAKAAETDDGLIYVAELSCAKKTAHHLTGERCRTLTSKDVRDCADVSFHPGTDVVELPMWDRGHSFVGAPGVGSCLHVDQAWWSNVAKNFTGLKLVALWGPDHAAEIVQRHEGELFRRLSSLREMWCRRLGMDVEAFLRGSDSESCCTPYSALSLVPH